MHPWLGEKGRVENEQPDAKDESQNARGPGNGIPQAAFHNRILFDEYAAPGLFCARRLCMIHKQAKHIEEARKPSHHENDVKRFDDRVIFHGVKNRLSASLGFLEYRLKF